jgi:hypothetical protein
MDDKYEVATRANTNNPHHVTLTEIQSGEIGQLPYLVWDFPDELVVACPSKPALHEKIRINDQPTVHKQPNP